MSYNYLDSPDVQQVLLPDGSNFLLRVPYTPKDKNGVTVLIVASCLSLTAIVGLLVAISISAFNTRKSTDRHLFVRTHVAAYFVSMLITDILQSIGSIMSARWVRLMMVHAGPYCAAQGVIKQAADIGSSIWVLVIGIHTFCQLFLQMQIRPYVLWSTLVFVWSGIFTILLIGPAGLNTERRGPFYGISGYWCWIADNYPTERLTLDYMIMFLCTFLIFILYTLVFLRLRGNIIVDGWNIRIRSRSVSSANPWRGRDFDDNKVLGIARQMLLYPVAYTVLILPIAAARFSTWGGRKVPFEITIFCDTIFLLAGLVNVVLFITTRPVLPPQSISISRPRLLDSSLAVDAGADAYKRDASPDIEKQPQNQDALQSMTERDSISEISVSVQLAMPEVQPRGPFEHLPTIRPLPTPPIYDRDRPDHTTSTPGQHT